MTASPVRWASFALCVFVMGATQAVAQPSQAQDSESVQALRDEIERLKSDFEARLSALEAALAAAAAPAAPASSTPVQTGGDATGIPVYGSGSAASKVFNPDIAVIGNFVGTGGSNEVDPSPALDLPEAEASLQAIVDPYARADFFFAFGEEGVDVEEGFITFPTVPGGLLVKAGRMRQAFGKVNGMHSHILPWPDRPLVTENLLGGDEGIADAGISVARLIPNPWVFLEATGQVYRGTSGDIFLSSKPADLSYLGHLRAYQDVTEAINVDLGASVAWGHNDAGLIDDVDVGRLKTTLYGLDATVRWRPLQRSIYRSFIGRGEVIWSRRDQLDGQQNASGFFASAEYQFARRWSAGGRVDRSGRADDATATDSGQALLVSFRPSEFSTMRGQYRRVDYAEGSTANEFLFQLQFSIGAHGAHPF